MQLVLDASITISWLLIDEQDPLATRVFKGLGRDRGHAPFLWWYEVRNILVSSERRGRLTSADTRNFLQDLGGLPIELDHARSDHPVLDLARMHNLTFYDAAYLELALRTSFPLATLDAALIAAAKSEGVPLVAAK